MIELITKYHAGGAYQIAEVYAFQNHSTEAFGWLDRAYEAGALLTRGRLLTRQVCNCTKLVSSRVRSRFTHSFRLIAAKSIAYSNDLAALVRVYDETAERHRHPSRQ